MEKLKATVAANVKKYRKREKLSQEELGKKAGLHRTYIGSVERGERNITLSSLQTLAEALDVSPVSLIVDEDGNSANV